jgi:hypothetical protein
MEELIKEWIEKNISEAEFQFSCGGDSMGETDLLFYNDKKEVIDMDESDTLTDLIYKNVDFYENSDGHYQGEFGTVHITFNEEKDNFEYNKDSTSEYSNSYTDEVVVSLKEEEWNYLNKYVKDVYGEGEIDTFEYKIDFYKTNLHKKIEESIKKCLKNEIFNHEFEQGDQNVEADDYYNIEGLTILEDNKIKFNLTYYKTENECNN